MPSPVKAVVPFIDEQEAELKTGNPMDDVYFLAVPMATYKALAREAAKRNLTFAQMVTKAFSRVLEE